MPPRPFGTIKAKIAAIVIVLAGILGALTVYLSVGFYGNYRERLVRETGARLRFERERIAVDAKRLEHNARQLALIGELLHRYERDRDDFETFGRQAVERAFGIDDAAIGGGIWYAPGAFRPDRELVAFYAHSRADGVRYNSAYGSAEYHYPTQDWYRRIWERTEADPARVAWTAPYFDDADDGTDALMVTAGCGIRDAEGALIGLATVDWQLSKVADAMAAIRPTEGSFVLFADPQSDFVLASSDSRNRREPGDRLSEVPWYGKRSSDPGVETLRYDGTEFLSFKTVFGNGMVLVVNIPSKELFRDVNAALFRLVSLLAAIALTTAGIVYYLLSRFINRPVAYLSRKAEELGRGNLDTEIHLDSGDELGRLGDTLGSMAGNLKQYVRDLQTVTAEKERIGTELDIAREIQSSMLPSIFPPYPDRGEFDIYASMTPAREVGGDFYDFFMVDDDRLAVVIADVSGKGIPAALFMVIAKTLIHNHASLGRSPAAVLDSVNLQLCENNAVGMFVTAFIGILDVRTGVMEYANAGHNPPLVIKGGGAVSFLPVRPGFVLGGLPEIDFVQGRTVLEPGECLCLYTDGVSEAENAEGELYGTERLLACAARFGSEGKAGMTDLIAAVTRDVVAFADGAAQTDDMTMLGLCYGGREGCACAN